MEQVSQQLNEPTTVSAASKQRPTLGQKMNQNIHDKPWLSLAAIGIFHLGVGYFFGHRHRAK